jgi:Fe-S-cluster-containing dehydrogenase component/CRP-like cAMP-binding protein
MSDRGVAAGGARRGRWPSTVWQSPWLRGLDDTCRALLEEAGDVRVLERGERVFSRGDPADAFFVVHEGLVDVWAVRRGEAEAGVVRRAAAGDAVGEEAIVRAGGPRAAEAVCASRSRVAEVPVALFRRAMDRAVAAPAKRLESTLRRSAARDVLRASSVAQALTNDDIGALLDCCEHRLLARGEALFAQGTPVTHAYVVADGMLALQTEDGDRLRIRAYLSRGDLVADVELESGGSHEVTAAACGPAWVLAVPRGAVLRAFRASPAALARARRIASPAGPPEQTRHVLGDLWRFSVARSMLVIDDEACVRCGHCSWSCAQAHDDGVSRLVRRGEKVVVRDAADGAARALIVPASCQHCRHPACMLECPTGAIGRDVRGDVFVREDLCVGCGQCVKACPWGSVQMAPRGDGGGHVAVKCDGCRDRSGGPACVSACPVDAIARVDPVAVMREVRQAIGAPEQAPSPHARAAKRRGSGLHSNDRRDRNGETLPKRRSAGPWIVAATIVACALAHVASGVRQGQWASGIVAGTLMAALGAYAAVKRLPLLRARTPNGSRLRAHTIAHLALGVLAMGAVCAHAGLRVPANAAGALSVAFWIASGTGLLGAIAYRVAPRVLARVERRALLPEDVRARATELDERAFGVLTGRGDATKQAYARVVAPYAGAVLGPLALLARRTSLREEEARLKERVSRVFERRAADMDGLEDVIRLAVERRAVAAQRLLQLVLRGWLPLHVVAAAIAMGLLVVHVIAATRVR